MTNFWQHEHFVIPLSFLFLALIDEYIFRRCPHVGLLLSTLMLLAVLPIEILIGIDKTWIDFTFTLVKSCVLLIPTIIICLFRLAYASVNVDKIDIDDNSTPANTPTAITDNDQELTPILSPRRIEYTRMYKYLPNSLIRFITNKKYFLSDKWRNYFDKILYITFVINLSQTLIYELFVTKNYYHSKYDWSRYINSFTLFCLILTFPMPWDGINKKYCYTYSIDTRYNSKYSDIIVDVVGKRIRNSSSDYNTSTNNQEMVRNFGNNNNNNNYNDNDKDKVWLDILTILWMILMSSVSWEIILRAYGYNGGYWALLYLTYVFIKSLSYSSPLAGSYLQSIMSSTLVFVVILRHILHGVINIGINNNNKDKPMVNGFILIIISLINGLVGLGYTIAWIIINIIRKEKACNEEVNKYIEEIAKFDENKDDLEEIEEREETDIHIVEVEMDDVN